MRYRFDVLCPRCAGELVHRADGTPGLLETAAVADCSACRLELVVRVQLLPTYHTVLPTPPEPEPVRDMSAPFAPLIDLMCEATPR